MFAQFAKDDVTTRVVEPVMTEPEVTAPVVEPVVITVPVEPTPIPPLVRTTSSDGTHAPKLRAATAAKAIVKFVKAYEAASIKCGLLDNEPLDESEIKHLASLPSKDILRAKVVGGLKSPITGFVMSLSSPMRGLVMVLNAIKDKK